jgi:hypothetical protein
MSHGCSEVSVALTVPCQVQLCTVLGAGTQLRGDEWCGHPRQQRQNGQQSENFKCKNLIFCTQVLKYQAKYKGIQYIIMIFLKFMIIVGCVHFVHAHQAPKILAEPL